MSFVVSGPRRIYVLVFFWQRVDSPSKPPRPLASIERAMDVATPAGSSAVSAAVCRPVVAMRLHRVLGSRLVGLSFLVLDAQARHEPHAASADAMGETPRPR